MRPLVVCLALVIAGCGYGAPDGTTDGGTSPVTTSPVTTSPVTTSPTGDGPAPDGITATVLEVVDGDSLTVQIAGASVDVRLLGIDAPEVNGGECFATEARSRLRGLVGDQVVLVGDDTDQYGRLLAYAYSGSTNVNLVMISEGAATALTVTHPLLSDFVASEEDAVARSIGLWNPASCGSTATDTVSIWAIQSDAPGRDDENPNGEWVVITASAETDLTGWTIRDESTVHTYEFPDGFVIRTGEFIRVLSGCGADVGDVLHWCADGPVWNNQGDMVLLLDGNGAVVDRLRYSE